jgi:putative transposase
MPPAFGCELFPIQLNFKTTQFNMVDELLDRYGKRNSKTGGICIMKQVDDPRRAKGLGRFLIISPLLEPDLEPAELTRRRKEILDSGAMSERTLRRQIRAYEHDGFDGLVPGNRSDKGVARTISPEILAEAAGLKAELRERSTETVIAILEGENKIKDGEIARSTLARHLHNMGLTGKEVAPIKATRRFQKEHRNMLWQTDLKYGPFLPHPGNPSKHARTYLIAYIDDATRLICHAEFYLDQKLPIIEDSFRKAILKRGLPDKIYVDNGKIFVSQWFRMACAKLNISHIHTAPYSPEAKGKIERFNRTIEAFLAEVQLIRPQTLAQLNQVLFTWVEEGYNHKVHSELKETPAVRFASDDKKLRFVNPDECRQAFLWEEERKVDKTGCAKHKGRVYEVGVKWVGKKVLFRYDPFHFETLEIWYENQYQGLARELEICSSNHRVMSSEEKTPSLPPDVSKQANVPTKPAESRLMNVLESKAKKRREQRLGATAFRNMEGGADHV